MAAILDGSGTNNFETAVAVNPPRRSFPIIGDVATEMLEQDYRQFLSNFSATALSTVHPSAAAFYLVAETPRRPLGADVVEWTRVYSEIPAQRNEYQTFAYRIPGLNGTQTYSWKLITTSSGTPTVTLTTNVVHGLSAGDNVYVGYWFTDSGTGGSFSRLARREVIAAPTTTTFTVTEIIEDGTVNYQKVVNSGTIRRPRSESVNSRLQFDYYVPGVSGGITTPADITILQPTKILDPEGNEVDSYNDLTTPSQDTYLASTVGNEIVVQESSLSRWHGDIWERVTRYAEAR